MKKILYTFLIVLAGASFSFGQELQVLGAKINPTPLEEGGLGSATFNFFLLNSNIPDSDVKITVTFTNIAATGTPTGAGADLFDWAGNPAGTGFLGTQKGPMNAFQGGPINFDLNVTGIATQDAFISININEGTVTSNTDDGDFATDNVEIEPAGALPVELLSFTGRRVDEVHVLNWETASEQNNAGFEVQRSTDGQAWESLGWVDGFGTTNTNQKYDFVDKTPYIGGNYYRLQQFDYDGTNDFSNIVYLENFQEAPIIQVLPNPSPRDFVVTVANPNNSKMKITLFNSHGVAIFETGLIEDVRLWQKEFSLVQQEMYFISVNIGKETYTEKIVIISKA